eukprot:Nitzschia sp. Nitz4//scaffold4_size323378//265332//265990//NITZ4_000703-RA/size323378-snap-gene-0.429-mRNA-1//1//CDS//3329553528//4952//frame0
MHYRYYCVRFSSASRTNGTCSMANMFWNVVSFVLLLCFTGILWVVLELTRKSKEDWQQWRTALIDVLGNFAADLLEHPRLQDALAQVVTNGMNHTIEQPDLGARLQNVSESLREDNLKMSRALGEQLPDLAANLVGGALSTMRQKKKVEGSKVPVEPSALQLDTPKSKKNT